MIDKCIHNEEFDGTKVSLYRTDEPKKYLLEFFDTDKQLSFDDVIIFEETKPVLLAFLKRLIEKLEND